ncbi:MAG: hypothetical protein COA32_08950 [Fluviicola sp.]|nr:MAG: hypothetical protein COA32_08950 [Fluviicola sp.]
MVVSCSTTETIHNCDLRSYFYSPEQFSQPKIHVFKKDSLGYKSTEYWKFERIEPNKIQITMYNNEGIKTSQLIDKFEDNQVVLDYIDIAPQNGKTTKVNIESGTIFNFDNNKPEYGYKVNYSGEYPQRFDLTDSTLLKRVELVQKEINGNMVNTIVSKGYTHFSEEYSKSSFKVPLTIWYSKGIGVTFMKEDYNSESVIYKYVETIDSTDLEVKLKQ